MFNDYLDIITFSSLPYPQAINPLDRISIISKRKKSLSQIDKDGVRIKKGGGGNVIKKSYTIKGKKREGY